MTPFVPNKEQADKGEQKNGTEKVEKWPVSLFKNLPKEIKKDPKLE